LFLSFSFHFLTFKKVLDDTLKINQGHLLCHAGSVMHAGVGINKGERWVFVLFVLGESQPQFSRRCHAQALECIQDRQLKQAEEVLQTGLRVATNDHLLHNTMGRLHLMKQEPKMAIKSFQSADNAYPVCQKAMVSIAQILMNQRRPRAALRRLNLVLDRIDNRDLKPDSQMSLKGLAFGARRDAARCALLCAEYNNAKQQQNQHGDDDQTMMEWNRMHLAVAIDRMKTCLNAAPNEPNLLGMLDRAEFLFKEAQ
jgi:tetratricopeptide (TPR) repeat protein